MAIKLYSLVLCMAGRYNILTEEIFDEFDAEKFLSMFSIYS